MAITFAAQMDLEATALSATPTFGTDISAYVVEVPSIELGMATSRDRVAAGGRATIIVNNADGRFSPENAAGAYYGQLKPGVPIRVQALGGVVTRTLFIGVIRDIVPAPGELGGKRAVITCQDRISQMQDTTITLPVQRDKTADYLLKLIGSEAFMTGVATATVDLAANASAGESVTLDGTTYTWQSAISAAGDVLLGDTATDSVNNMVAAMRGGDGAGTLYATGTTAQTRVTVENDEDTATPPAVRLTATATARGEWGNSIELTSSEGVQRVALGATVTVGSVASGSVYFTHYADGAEFVIAEAASTPGFSVNLPVENLTATGQELRILGYYDGTAGHTVNVLAFNGVDFDVLGTLPEAAAPAVHTFTLDPSHTYGNTVLIVITHTSAGDASHRLHLDHLYVLDSASAPSGNMEISGATLYGGWDGPTSAISYQDGQRVFTVAADRWTVDHTTAMQAARDVVESERGFIWASRTGTVTFKNASWEFGLFDATPTLTLDGGGVIIGGGMRLDDIYNRVTVRYQPRATLSAGVVAKTDRVIDVPPGKGTVRDLRLNPTEDYKGAATTVQLRYTDPATGQPMGAESLQQLVAGTDYKVFNQVGQNITSAGYIITNVVDAGSACDATFVSLRSANLEIHDLQVRGVGIVSYEPRSVTLDDPASQDAYGRNEAVIALPLESDQAQNIAESMVAFWLGQWSTPAYRVESVTLPGPLFLGTQTAFDVELGDVLLLSEDQTAVDSQRLLVVGLLYANLRDGGGYVTYRTRRVDTMTYWRLDDATYSVLGSTTRLAV